MTTNRLDDRCGAPADDLVGGVLDRTGDDLRPPGPDPDDGDLVTQREI